MELAANLRIYFDTSAETGRFRLKIDLRKCGDAFQLTAAEGAVRLALRIAGAVGRRGDDGFGLRKQVPGPVREDRAGELLPDIRDGLRRRVYEVVGIETVVAQIVGNYFIGRKIRRTLTAFFGYIVV